MARVTTRKLNAARAWHADFAPVNDAYNVSKFGMKADEMRRILRAAEDARGMDWRHATLTEVNRAMEAR